MNRHHFLPVSAVVVAVLTTGCGTEVGGTPIQGSPVVETTTSTTETEEAVPDRPYVDWDSPVIDGIEVTAENAQEVAGAAFDVLVPTLRNGTLLKILATDPERYPEGFLGYGVLYDVATDDGETLRLLIEQTPVSSPGEGELIRNMASNGPGFDLELVDGVEVVFIHPGERASALLLQDGVKYNINGPGLTLPVVREAVTAIIAQTQ